jgi:DNA-binding XRE family transcriptional regulator
MNRSFGVNDIGKLSSVLKGLQQRLRFRQFPAILLAQNRLSATRIAANLTQQELATLIGVRRVTLARWEAGSRRPLGIYAERYGAALSGLMSVGEDNPGVALQDLNRSAKLVQASIRKSLREAARTKP